MTWGWIKGAWVLLVIPILVGGVIHVATKLYDQYQSRRQILAVVEGPFPLEQLSDLGLKIRVEYGKTSSLEPAPKVPPPVPAESQKAAPAQATVPPKAPTGLLPTLASVTVHVEVPVADLHIYRVTIRNTGSLPIRDLPVRVVFEKAKKDFMLLAVKHKTTPAKEFGIIKDDYTETASPRWVYELLNPGDEDVITALTNEKTALNLYSKAEGVSVEIKDQTVSTASRVAEFRLWVGIMSSTLTLVIVGVGMAGRTAIRKAR